MSPGGTEYTGRQMYLDTGDEITTLEVFRVGGASFSGGAHAVLVVLADKYARKIPQLSLIAEHQHGTTEIGKGETDHVESLEDLSLVAGTITVHGKGRLGLV
jgi:hypothetical protein